MQSEALKHARVSRRLLMSSCAWLLYKHPQALCTFRVLNQNHYEVLGVKKDCALAEVKDQFIRLSKEFHPDTNQESSGCHKRFISINEAYSVLSKPELRRAYDAELLQQSMPTMQTYGDIRTNAPMGRVVFRDDSLWEHRDKTECYNNRNKPYYGVKGVKKMPNSYIAAGAVIFMIVGAIFHYIAAKTSSDYTIKQLNLRDKTASQHHLKAREYAKANGNELQLALLRQRCEEANRK